MNRDVFISKIIREVNKFNLSEEDIYFIMRAFKNFDMKIMRPLQNILFIFTKKDDIPEIKITDRKELFSNNKIWDKSLFIIDLGLIYDEGF